MANTHRTRKKRGIVLVFLALLFVFVVVAIQRHFLWDIVYPNKETMRILLTENGFSPAEATVTRGTTVIFTTGRDKPFWPASNLHPTHEIYPELDPKEPVDPPKTWSFRFNKIGSWRYHDHLWPAYTGTITVVERDFSQRTRLSSDIQNSCSGVTGVPKEQCFADLLTSTVRTQGLDAGFAAFKKYYAADTFFARGCHEYMHVLGLEAYRLIAGNKTYSLPSQAGYCGFGFFHGFIEMLMRGNKDFTLAQTACTFHDADTFLALTKTLDCYHGIGHAVSDTYETHTLSDLQSSIDASLTKCESISKTPQLLQACAGGVFNSVVSYFSQSQDPNKPTRLRGEWDKKNPFSLCYRQKPVYMGVCIGFFTTLFTEVDPHNFANNLTSIRNTSDMTYQAEAVKMLAEYTVYLEGQEKEYSDHIEACRSLDEPLRASCMEGTINGLMIYGPPEKEYERAFLLCDSKGFTPAEKHSCFVSLIDRTKFYYGVNKYREVCRKIGDEYAAYCEQTP